LTKFYYVFVNLPIDFLADKKTEIVENSAPVSKTEDKPKTDKAKKTDISVEDKKAKTAIIRFEAQQFMASQMALIWVHLSALFTGIALFYPEIIVNLKLTFSLSANKSYTITSQNNHCYFVSSGVPMTKAFSWSFVTFHFPPALTAFSLPCLT
jgi:hypothetical protein